MPKTFLSYVREDSELVAKLADGLRANGVDIWLDRDEILPGDRWGDAIRNGIRDGDFFVACFSANYETRGRSYMNEELSIAIEELRLRPNSRRWFIPVVLTPSTVPDRPIGAGGTLQDLHWVELYRDWDHGIQQLCKAMGASSNFTPSELRTFLSFEEGALGVMLERARLDGFILLSENDLKEFFLSLFNERIQDAEARKNGCRQIRELYKDATDEPTDLCLRMKTSRSLDVWLAAEIQHLTRLAENHLGDLVPQLPPVWISQQKSALLARQDALSNYYLFAWRVIESKLGDLAESGRTWWQVPSILLRQGRIEYGQVQIIKKFRFILQQVLTCNALCEDTNLDYVIEYMRVHLGIWQLLASIAEVS